MVVRCSSPGKPTQQGSIIGNFTIESWEEGLNLCLAASLPSLCSQEPAGSGAGLYAVLLVAISIWWHQTVFLGVLALTGGGECVRWRLSRGPQNPGLPTEDSSVLDELFLGGW